MLLEQLRDFEWLNEPENVIFRDGDMTVAAVSKTDFWQNRRKNIHRDNGHFFFARCSNNFTMTVHWSFPELLEFRQCGLMLRFDEQNWLKAAVMASESGNFHVNSCVVNAGCPDFARQSLSSRPSEIWFRARRSNSDFTLFYSLNGTDFYQLRQFSFILEDAEIKAGAYICSPANSGFEAVLHSIDFS